MKIDIMIMDMDINIFHLTNIYLFSYILFFNNENLKTDFRYLLTSLKKFNCSVLYNLFIYSFIIHLFIYLFVCLHVHCIFNCIKRSIYMYI